MKNLFYFILIVIPFIGCKKYECAKEECAEGLLKAEIPSTINRIVITEGNGTFHLRKQSETAFFFPGGWIHDHGYNKFTISGNTLTIKNTFSDSYISLISLDGIEIVDGNSTTYVSKSFAHGSMEMSIGGNATIFFDDVCGDEGNNAVTPRSSNFDLDLDVYQNGTLHGYAVGFRNVDANVNSNGTVKVAVQDQLIVKIPNNGTVYYKGSPVISSSIGLQGSLIDEN